MDCPAATGFCDFDGTVTSVDTFDAVAERAAPELWAELKTQLFQFEINLRQGMQALADGLTPNDLEGMGPFGGMDDFTRHKGVECQVSRAPNITNIWPWTPKS